MKLERHPCPLCGASTSTVICAFCAEDLSELGVELLSPDATFEQFKEWVAQNEISIFVCDASTMKVRRTS